MLTGSDTEYQRRFEKAINELFVDCQEKLAFHAPKEDLDVWRGKLRMLRQIGQICKQIETEMRTG